jgi:hypothetical protein
LFRKWYEKYINNIIHKCACFRECLLVTTVSSVQYYDKCTYVDNDLDEL